MNILDTLSVGAVINRPYAAEELTRMSAPEYWTRDGLKKTAGFKILDPQTLVVLVQEPASSYPLLIDPTLLFSPASPIPARITFPTISVPFS